MKVLIRDKQSKECLFSAGAWTGIEGEALDFETVSRAREFCMVHQLRDVEIVAQERPGETSIVMPVREPKRQPTEALHEVEW
jgi:hypothetical protein